MRIAVVTVLLAALLAGCTSSPPKSPTAPVSVPIPPVSPEAPSQTAPAPAPPASPGPDLSRVLDVAWSPDPDSVALLMESGLAIFYLRHQQLTPWPFTYARHMTLAGWTPNGSGVYVVTPDHALLVVDQFGGHDVFAPSQPLQPSAIRYEPSPSGRLIVYDASTKKLRLIGGTGAWDGDFMGWSPAGRYLAYNDSRSLHVVDVASVRDTVAGAATHPQWNPRGESFLAVDTKGMAVRSVSGDILLQVPGATFADWSSDGTRLVFQDRAGVWTIDADGKDRQPLLKDPIEALQRMVWLAQDEIVFCTVGQTAGGGTTFAMHLITGGKIQHLAGGTRSTLLVSPNKRRVAYLVGPPADDIPASLEFYPPMK